MNKLWALYTNESGSGTSLSLYLDAHSGLVDLIAFLQADGVKRADGDENLNPWVTDHDDVEGMQWATTMLAEFRAGNTDKGWALVHDAEEKQEIADDWTLVDVDIPGGSAVIQLDEEMLELITKYEDEGYPDARHDIKIEMADCLLDLLGINTPA